MVRHSQEEKAGKKKVSESRPGGPVAGKRPPQSTKMNPDPEDEGKTYYGVNDVQDVGADGTINRPSKMKEFDIYKDHR